MYELRYLPGAERYFKKIKDKGLKTAFRTALIKSQRIHISVKQKSAISLGFMALMSTTTRPITRSHTEFMKRMGMLWSSS